MRSVDKPSRAASPAARPTPAGAAAGLRVVHLTHDMRSRWLGIRTSVLALGGAQRARGCTVVARCVDGPRDDEDPSTLPIPVVASRAAVGAPLYLSPSAERWAGSPAAAEFDVLHQHGIWSAVSRATARWRAAHGRPTVVAPHGSLEPVALSYSRWKKWLALRWYERENLARASCLHATTASEVDGFRDFGLRNPIAVMPNGGDSDRVLEAAGDADRFRRAHRLPRDARVLLFLSRIHPKKGLDDLVEAMARLGDALGPWHLVIAGPEEAPAHAAGVRALVERRGLVARVHWVGPLLGAAKYDALAAAELFVLPTRSDNYGIVVAEALNAGVPVVTTRGALPWSVLESRGCGWWAPVGAAGLAGALAHATALPADALAAMGRRGVALMRTQHRWADTAAQSVALYRWLLGEGARPDFVIVG